MANPLLETITQKKMVEDPRYEYGSILPFKKNIETREVSFALPAVLRSIINAATAPGRALQGQTDYGDALNFALNTAGYGWSANSLKPAQYGVLSSSGAKATVNAKKGSRFIKTTARTKKDFPNKNYSYRGGHTAPVDPEYHAPLYKMNKTYPDDIYSSKAMQYYGHGDPDLDIESFQVINKVRGKPNADVTIYRAVPKGAADDIYPGDWVTINKKYAIQHGEGLEDYKILTTKVKAKQLRTDGNSPHEFGYVGD